MAYEVDLSDPDELQQILDQYIVHKVFPVESEQPPGLFQPVHVKVHYPGARTAVYAGQVIQIDGNSFLVQVDEPPDVRRIRFLIQRKEAAESMSQMSSDYSDAYAKVRSLPINEKRKAAAQGNKTVRQLLINDTNKSLHIFVLKNPKIGLDEIQEYAKLPGLSPEAIRFMLRNRNWMNSRQLVLNLTRNPSTPTDLALRLVDRLSLHELRVIARSSEVRPAIQSQARKRLLEKSG